MICAWCTSPCTTSLRGRPGGSSPAESQGIKIAYGLWFVDKPAFLVIAREPKATAAISSPSLTASSRLPRHSGLMAFAPRNDFSNNPVAVGDPLAILLLAMKMIGFGWWAYASQYRPNFPLSNKPDYRIFTA